MRQYRTTAILLSSVTLVAGLVMAVVQPASATIPLTPVDTGTTVVSTTTQTFATGAPTFPALSADQVTEGLALSGQVAAATNRQAAFNALTLTQQQEVVAATVPTDVTMTDTLIRTTLPISLKGVGTDSSPPTYCWVDERRVAGRSAMFRFTALTWWQMLKWCGNWGHIVYWKVLDRGGETSTPLWAFDGDDGQGAYNASWEIRSYTKEKFTYGLTAGFFTIGYSPSVCVQIRGGATGFESASTSCALM